MKLNRSRSFAIERGKHPESGNECDFKISTEKILWRHKYGPTDVFYNLRNVPFALTNPTAIFKGLERIGHENSYCYVAKVMRRFVSDSDSEPVEDDWIFLVFVTANLEIFDWRFERQNTRNGLPENEETRFTKLIWPNRP